MDRLPDELIVMIMEYLKAVDYAALQAVNKTIFSSIRVSRAVKHQLARMYCIPSLKLSPQKELTANRDLIMWPEVLNSFEFASILFCLRQINFSAPRIAAMDQYWISCLWVTQARKYYTFDTKLCKKGKYRRKRGIAPAPTADINIDITCPHGAMYSGKVSDESAAMVVHRTRKTAISGEQWRLLRRFYPTGHTFCCVMAEECTACENMHKLTKANRDEQNEKALRKRKNSVVSEDLIDLFKRKSGVPAARLTPKTHVPSALAAEAYLNSITTVAAAVASATDAAPTTPPHPSRSASTAATATALYSPEEHDAALSLSLAYADYSAQPTAQPLLPGLYNLVPRAWLRSWRRYAKDLSVPADSLPPLDCRCLRCEHYDLVVPVHLTEYLLGLRKMLFTGLNADEDKDDAVEIVTTEEWDAMGALGLTSSDVNPSFALDGADILWNLTLCETCNRH